MENNKNFGYRIRTIMENLTLQEFADSINVTVRALSNYLAGRVPRKSVLQKICDRYGVVPRWLLTGEGPMYKTDSSQNLDHDQGFMPIKEAQHANFTENTNQKNLDHDQGSFDVDFFARYIKLAEEHAATVRENAEHRVQAERHLSRIRDLERENAEIPALKARIAELERELSERPKQPKVIQVDVSAKSKPTPGHGTGADKTVVPGAGAGDSCAGSLGASVGAGE